MDNTCITSLLVLWSLHNMCNKTVPFCNQGHPEVMLHINFVEFESMMPHAKIQDPMSLRTRE